MKGIGHRALSLWLLGCLLAFFGAACGDEGGGSRSGGGAGVSQGGSQDFGLFRDVLLRGEIPGPETLDELGFFNEHKIELPDPDCGQDICIHGLLGVMANMISGSNCTMILIGLNTPIDPAEMSRPPLDLAVSVDVSGSMSGEKIQYVQEGLLAMLPELDDADRVTLVTYSDQAEVVVVAREPASLELENAIRDLEVGGQTNIYDGLRVAYESLPEATADRQRRVILLSDGVATAGLESDARVERMARGYSAEGIGLTTIGVGDEFNVDLMRALSETGAGNFYFVEDPRAVREVFTEEVNTFLVPIASDVTIDVLEGSGYSLRRIHGTRLWGFMEGGATIRIPSLFVAGRVSVDDDQLGRRGGGGAIIVELLPRSGAANLGPGRVGELTFSYTDPVTGAPFTDVVDVESSLSPGETPEGGVFSNASVEKAFVMLNIYVGFEMAAERAKDGALSDALGVLRALRGNVANWLRANEDADIEADFELIDLFIDNLVAAGATNPPASAAPEPWPQD